MNHLDSDISQRRITGIRDRMGKSAYGVRDIGNSNSSLRSDPCLRGRRFHVTGWNGNVRQVVMMEERGLVRGNLDEKYIHVLVREDEVMVTFLAHGDAAGGVGCGSLSGEGECGNSDDRAESE